MERRLSYRFILGDLMKALSDYLDTARSPQEREGSLGRLIEAYEAAKTELAEKDSN